MNNMYTNKEGLLDEKRAQVNTQQTQQNNFAPTQQDIAAQIVQKTAQRTNKSRFDEITEDVKKTYNAIFNAYGKEAANEWMKQQMIDNYQKLDADNTAVIKEIQEKYAEIYSIPAVQQAIQAYIEMDLNPSISLREQNFHQVIDYISTIYKAGYDSAMGFKTENDSAKSRMNSAVNTAMPHMQASKVFTRADIKAMSPEEFLKNEKIIFHQLNQGLIK